MAPLSLLVLFLRAEDKIINMQKNEILLEHEFDDWLSQQKGTVFCGTKASVNPFTIALFEKPYIVTESVEEGRYPSCYALNHEILLRGIKQEILANNVIHNGTQYAKEVEYSTIKRESNSGNKGGALTKYYFTIHKSFINFYNKKLIVKVPEY